MLLTALIDGTARRYVDADQDAQSVTVRRDCENWRQNRHELAGVLSHALGEKEEERGGERGMSAEAIGPLNASPRSLRDCAWLFGPRQAPLTIRTQ